MNNLGSVIQLKEAIKLENQKVTLLGVVMEYSIPRKSRGTDCVSVLKIVDESHQSPEISVNIFTKKLEDLPHLKSARDLILLSRVLIKKHNGEVYAVFNKKFSSFALFDRKSSQDFCPYQASSRFCLLEHDTRFIVSLRKWCLSFRFDAGTSAYLLSIKEIKEREYFDLVCKVLHVYEVSKDQWMLFVWDGTDTPPLSLHTKLKDEEHKPLPLQIESLALPGDVLSTFPRVGTVLRVTSDQAYEKLGLHFQGNGQWVRFRNMTSQVCSGLWQGLLIPSSKVRLLSKKDNSVVECKRNYDERLSREQGRVPFWSSNFYDCLTVTDYERAPFATLRDILTYSEVNARFKCVVRVIAIYPSQAKDFRSPVGLCEYRIRLTLEDPTARIHALICAEDGVKFFEGYPPIDVLTIKMNKLLGVHELHHSDEDNDSPRSPPWIRCCIKSCHSNEIDAQGNRHYQIFGTRLVA